MQQANELVKEVKSVDGTSESEEIKKQPCEVWLDDGELRQRFWSEERIKHEIDHALSTLDFYDDEKFNRLEGKKLERFTHKIYEELDHNTSQHYHPEKNSKNAILDREYFLETWREELFKRLIEMKMWFKELINDRNEYYDEVLRLEKEVERLEERIEEFYKED